MKKTTLFSLIILILSLILFTFLRFQSLEKNIFSTQPSSPPTQKETMSSIKSLKINTFNHKSISIGSLNKKLYIVNFWATWCLPCLVEIPHLVELYNSYPKKDILILGISMDKNKNIVKQYLNRNPLPFPIGMYKNEYQRIFGSISGIPTTYFYDENFNLVHISEGYSSKEVFDNIITQLMER